MNLLRRTLLTVAVTIVPLLLQGCLMSEEDEYTVKLNEDGKSGTITVVKYNVQSDQNEAAKQWEDFNDLIHDWKSDQYLLEKTKEGVYVKNRELWTRGGKLIWKETAIFADFSRLFRNEIVNDTLRLSFDQEHTVLATNGVLVQGGEKTVVLWPPKTAEFKLRLKNNTFNATSDFAKKFRKMTKR